MAHPIHIADPRSGMTARVTEFGQLVTSSVAYSTPVTGTLAVDDTAVNFVEPKGKHQIVVTDIILSSDKNVGVDGAAVVVYCADAIDSTTVAVGILEVNMLKNTARDLIGLNLIVGEGKWVNAKTDDNNIEVTIGYYRVPID